MRKTSRNSRPLGRRPSTTQHKRKEGGVQFIRSGTKGDEQHQRWLKNMRRNIKKLNTTMEKTINNTTQKEKGVGGV